MNRAVMAKAKMGFYEWKRGAEVHYHLNRTRATYGEAYLQYLTKAGRSDLAQKVRANPNLNPSKEKSRDSVLFTRFVIWLNDNW